MSENECPLTAASRLLSRKWSLVIVYYLLFGEKSFTELERLIRGISSKTLSETLTEMVEMGVVERVVDPGPPVRVKYRLTDMGRELRSVIVELSKWSCKWLLKGRGHCEELIPSN
ncbi:MAG: helix-turn-helix transcriptional regulator [Desulfurococcales archaeon]|nr:helix-turn-helix transcriptional regulator [Desulfurococcales archaeon]